MTLDKISERVAVMEKKAEHLERRVESMEKHSEALNSLKTSVEILALTNENQNKQIEQQSKQFEMVNESMKNINDNLVNLNLSQKEMHTELSKQGERIGKIEEIQEDSTISIGALMKTIIVGFLTTVGGGILLYGAVQLGLK